MGEIEKTRVPLAGISMTGKLLKGLFAADVDAGVGQAQGSCQCLGYAAEDLAGGRAVANSRARPVSAR